MSVLTKHALDDALKEVLKKKSFNRVTIKDITDTCGVNRMTFYYHFVDMRDLIEWSLTENILKNFKMEHIYQMWKENLRDTFNAMIENRAYVYKIVHSKYYQIFEMYVYNISSMIMLNVINERASGWDISEKDKVFISDFYSYALSGVVLKWIETEMKEDPQYMINHIEYIIEGDIDKAIMNITNQERSEERRVG